MPILIVGEAYAPGLQADVAKHLCTQFIARSQPHLGRHFIWSSGSPLQLCVLLCPNLRSMTPGFLSSAIKQHVRRLSPPLTTVLINSYRTEAYLFVDGDVIKSREGTIQGDPLFTPMYAIATIPIIKRLNATVNQVWYADNVAGMGHIRLAHGSAYCKLITKKRVITYIGT